MKTKDWKSRNETDFIHRQHGSVCFQKSISSSKCIQQGCKIQSQYFYIVSMNNWKITFKNKYPL